MVAISEIGTLELLVHIIYVVVLLNVLQISQGTLGRLLEGALVVNINISVVVIDHNNSAIGWI
jgi:hypothetical protein